MYFVYDVDLVFPHLRWDSHLIDKISNILNRVVWGGIQLKDIKGKIVVFRSGFIAIIDFFGKYTRTSGFTDSTRSAEQQGLCKVIFGNRIL